MKPDSPYESPQSRLALRRSDMLTLGGSKGPIRFLCAAAGIFALFRMVEIIFGIWQLIFFRELFTGPYLSPEFYGFLLGLSAIDAIVYMTLCRTFLKYDRQIRVANRYNRVSGLLVVLNSIWSKLAIIVTIIILRVLSPVVHLLWLRRSVL